MTPGRSRPLYKGGALGVCGVTACASVGSACATAVAAAASAGNAFIIWRRFMAYPLESRSCDRRYYTPFRAAILRCGRDWSGTLVSLTRRGLDVIRSVVSDVHREIESFRTGSDCVSRLS